MNSKEFKNLNNSTNKETLESISSKSYGIRLAKDTTYEWSRIVHPVDYSDPNNFAKYGSAEKYYSDTIKYIYNTYPYDGSTREKQDWRNNSSDLDLYFIDNLYPKSTGFINLGPANGNITQTNYYRKSTKPQYVIFYGGPHAGSTIEKSNIIDSSTYRFSNLNLNFNQGNTVEFWFKEGFVSSSAAIATNPYKWKYTILDIWNNKTALSSEYSRLLIQRDNNLNYFYLTIGSGSTVEQISIPLYTQDPNTWHHYAFSIKNNEDFSGKTVVKLYVDGQYKLTVASTTTFNQLQALNLTGTLGASQLDDSNSINLGFACASGSFDEFRFWKEERSEKQIRENLYSNVGGGSNSDTESLYLGVYYRFNEGISDIQDLDTTVLDYSGRITNGYIQNYTLNVRDTGSAINSVNDTREQEDPIVYSDHPSVKNLFDTYKLSGSYYDESNANALINTLPGWILDEEEHEGRDEISNLFQILSSYLDNLHIQAQHLPKIRNTEYVEGKYKTYPFYSKLLGSYDFDVSELFKDANFNELFYNKNNDVNFENKISEIKNYIFRNIYNNLIYINKSKGTFKSFRNLLRCFGIDENILKLNIYSNNDQYLFDNKTEEDSLSKNCLNFSTYELNSAVAFQSASVFNDNDEKGYVTGIASSNYYFVPHTLESEIIFPVINNNSNNYIVKSSLFGMHEAASSETDLTWPNPEAFNFYVHAIRPNYLSSNAKFVLTSPALGITLETDTYDNVYNDEKWNFALRIKDEKYGLNDITGVDTNSKFILEFYGVNTLSGEPIKNFKLTSSLNYTQASLLSSRNKRLYVGANRQNFTGSVIDYSDVKVSSIRYWREYLTDEEINRHAQDPNIYGVINPVDKAYFGISALSNLQIPKIDTLILNWNFETVSGSDSTGKYKIYDLTSGSLNDLRYGTFSSDLFKKHSGVGFTDVKNSDKVVDRQYISIGKTKLPDVISGQQLIKILDENPFKTNKDIKPASYHISIEKSMYQTISEDMIKLFSSVSDFNNLIGHPLDNYKNNYSNLDYFKTLYFQKINNKPNLEKYIEFFKWIDSSIISMISSLIPASVSQTNVLSNVVESHILERNKVDLNKLTFLKTINKDNEITAPIVPLSALRYASQTPPRSPPGSEWALKRADRTKESSVASGVPEVDSAREYLRQVIYGRSDLYPRDGYDVREDKNFSVLKDEVKIYSKAVLINGENIDHQNRNKYSVFKDMYNISNNFKVFLQTNISSSKENIALSKQKIYSKISSSIEEIECNSDLVLPYKTYADPNTGKITVTNNLSDDYGINNEIGLQGPFTDNHVGGNIHRHATINASTDRSELYSFANTIEEINSVTNKPLALYRQERAKRPVNIRNIKNNLNKDGLGNYEYEYQYISLNGKLNYNFDFNLSGGISENSVNSANRLFVEETIPNRSAYKSVIVNRFSAHGAETGRSSLDFESGEYSVYNSINNRNLKVRKYLNHWEAAEFDLERKIYPYNHKVNKNTFYTITSGSSGITRRASYDNHFVNYQIPRSDAQYAWISSSLLYRQDAPSIYFTEYYNVLTDFGTFFEFLTSDKSYIYEGSSTDISALKYNGVSQSIPPTGIAQSSLRGVYFSSDGTKFYTVYKEEVNAVRQWNLTTAWDITTATVGFTLNMNTSGNVGDISDIFITSDGTMAFLCDSSTGYAFKLTMSTPWSLSTAVMSQQVDIGPTVGNFISNTPTGIHLDPTGQYLYITDGVTSTQHVKRSVLTTPYNLSTFQAPTTFNCSPNDNAESIRLSSDGKVMYVSFASTELIIAYKLSTPWDITTATFSSQTTTRLPIDNPDIKSVGLYFREYDTLYVADMYYGKLFEYNQTKQSIVGEYVKGNFDKILYGPNIIVLTESNEVILNPGSDVSIHDLLATVNGPYQYPSWKQIRNQENWISRLNRASNIITLQNREINGIGLNTFTRYREPVIQVNRGMNCVFYDDYFKNIVETNFEYDNDMEYFSNMKLQKDMQFYLQDRNEKHKDSKYSKYANLFKKVNSKLIVKDMSYSTRIYPDKHLQTLFENRFREDFDNSEIYSTIENYRQFWKNGVLSRIAPFGDNSYTSIGAGQDAKMSTGTRIFYGRTSHTEYSFVFAGAYADYRIQYTVSVDLNNTASIYPLDYSSKSITRSPSDTDKKRVYTYSKNIYGELRAYDEFDLAFAIRKQDIRGGINSSNIYYNSRNTRVIPRPQLHFINAGPRFVTDKYEYDWVWPSWNETCTTEVTGNSVWNWSRPYTWNLDNSPKGFPSYDTYQKFSQDFFARSYDYSCVPEYRFDLFSDHYIKNKDGDFSSFPTRSYENDDVFDPIDYLSVPGSLLNYATTVSELEEGSNFTKTYNSSRKFNLFIQEIPSKTKKLKLNVKAIKKLLPYRGFYPAERTVELHRLFFKSWFDINDGDYDAWGYGYGFTERSWPLQPTGALDPDSEYKLFYLPTSFDYKNYIPFDHQNMALFQPLFTPGILFNSIKTGIALDWASIITEGDYISGNNIYFMSSSKVYLSSIELGSEYGDYAPITSYIPEVVEPVICKDYNFRFPFESLLEFDNIIPTEFFNNKNSLYYLNPSVYSLIINSGSDINFREDNLRYPQYFLGEYGINTNFKFKDNRYKLAMHNFLAEIPNFFLKDGSLNKFVSRPQGKGFQVEKGVTYSMDISLDKINPDKDFIYSKYGVRNFYGPLNSIMSGWDEPKSGPTNPLINVNVNNFISNVSMLPHSPPHHYGKHIETVSFTAKDSRYYSIPEIFKLLKINSSNSQSTEIINNILNNFSTNPNLKYGSNVETCGEQWVINTSDVSTVKNRIRDSVAFRNKMPLTASINLKNITRDKLVRYDQSGNPMDISDAPNDINDRWVIQTKWECPIISTSEKIDFWGNYGDDTGESLNFTLQESTNINNKNTKSLIELCGFEPGTRKLGQIAEQKEISEAVVIIPYTRKINDYRSGDNYMAKTIDPIYGEERAFNTDLDTFDLQMQQYPSYFWVNPEIISGLLGLDFKGDITKDQIYTRITTKNKKTGDTIISSNNSIINTIKCMAEYNLPPHLDWLTNRTIEPFVMYIFEFKHILDKQDLLNIWNGLLPKIGVNCELDEISIEHNLEQQEFFHGKKLQDDIKWKIFKVKKRAADNYYKITADSRDDARFKFKFGTSEKQPEYTYNWPYDYFSLVEMINADATMTLTDDEPRKPNYIPRSKPLPPPAEPVYDTPPSWWDYGLIVYGDSLNTNNWWGNNRDDLGFKQRDDWFSEYFDVATSFTPYVSLLNKSWNIPDYSNGYYGAISMRNQNALGVSDDRPWNDGFRDASMDQQTSYSSANQSEGSSYSGAGYDAGSPSMSTATDTAAGMQNNNTGMGMGNRNQANNTADTAAAAQRSVASKTGYMG